MAKVYPTSNYLDPIQLGLQRDGAGVIQGPDMTALQYVQARAKVGLSGIVNITGLQGWGGLSAWGGGWVN